MVIIDEAYIDFVTPVAVPTARALLDEFPNVAIMRTFSKAYGPANYRRLHDDTYRVGKLYAKPFACRTILNTLSRGEKPLGDQEFVARTVSKCRGTGKMGKPL